MLPVIDDTYMHGGQRLPGLLMRAQVPLALEGGSAPPEPNDEWQRGIELPPGAVLNAHVMDSTDYGL